MCFVFSRQAIFAYTPTLLLLLLLVLGLLGSLHVGSCPTSPLLWLLDLFFELSASIYRHPMQHHLFWSFSCQSRFYFTSDACPLSMCLIHCIHRVPGVFIVAQSSLNLSLTSSTVNNCSIHLICFHSQTLRGLFWLRSKVFYLCFLISNH